MVFSLIADNFFNFPKKRKKLESKTTKNIFSNEKLALSSALTFSYFRLHNFSGSWKKKLIEKLFSLEHLTLWPPHCRRAKKKLPLILLTFEFVFLSFFFVEVCIDENLGKEQYKIHKNEFCYLRGNPRSPKMPKLVIDFDWGRYLNSTLFKTIELASSIKVSIANNFLLGDNWPNRSAIPFPASESWPSENGQKFWQFCLISKTEFIFFINSWFDFFHEEFNQQLFTLRQIIDQKSCYFSLDRNSDFWTELNTAKSFYLHRHSGSFFCVTGGLSSSINFSIGNVELVENSSKNITSNAFSRMLTVWNWQKLPLDFAGIHFQTHAIPKPPN